MNIKLTKELSEIELKGLQFLLNESWRKEEDLRLMPSVADPEYAKRAVHTKIHQTYHAGYFSARAVLFATFGTAMSNEFALSQAMGLLASEGLYGNGCTAQNNPYANLQAYRVSVDPKPVIEADPTAQIYRLINEAAGIALIHERHIVESIGQAAYRAVLQKTPEHLLESFVASRASLLFENTVTEIEL